jgi:hypothetical protein
MDVLSFCQTGKSEKSSVGYEHFMTGERETQIISAREA